MAHVQIASEADGGYVVSVDGVDVTHAVLARGFAVEFPPIEDGPALVHMTVLAETLEVDLPDAIVDALPVVASDV